MQTAELTGGWDFEYARRARVYHGILCAHLSLQDVADHCYVSQRHLGKQLDKKLEGA